MKADKKPPRRRRFNQPIRRTDQLKPLKKPGKKSKVGSKQPEPEFQIHKTDVGSKQPEPEIQIHEDEDGFYFDDSDDIKRLKIEQRKIVDMLMQYRAEQEHKRKEEEQNKRLELAKTNSAYVFALHMTYGLLVLQGGKKKDTWFELPGLGLSQQDIEDYGSPAEAALEAAHNCLFELAGIRLPSKKMLQRKGEVQGRVYFYIELTDDLTVREGGTSPITGPKTAGVFRVKPGRGLTGWQFCPLTEITTAPSLVEEHSEECATALKLFLLPSIKQMMSDRRRQEKAMLEEKKERDLQQKQQGVMQKQKAFNRKRRAEQRKLKQKNLEKQKQREGKERQRKQAMIDEALEMQKVRLEKQKKDEKRQIDLEKARTAERLEKAKERYIRNENRKERAQEIVQEMNKQLREKGTKLKKKTREASKRLDAMTTERQAVLRQMKIEAEARREEILVKKEQLVVRKVDAQTKAWEEKIDALKGRISALRRADRGRSKKIRKEILGKQVSAQKRKKELETEEEIYVEELKARVLTKKAKAIDFVKNREEMFEKGRSLRIKNAHRKKEFQNMLRKVLSMPNLSLLEKVGVQFSADGDPVDELRDTVQRLAEAEEQLRKIQDKKFKPPTNPEKKKKVKRRQEEEEEENGIRVPRYMMTFGQTGNELSRSRVEPSFPVSESRTIPHSINVTYHL